MVIKMMLNFDLQADRLAAKGESDNKKITLIAKIVLARVMLRKDQPLSLIKPLFGLSKAWAASIFKCLAITHYSVGNYVAR